MDRQPLATTREVADFTGIPERTLEQWRWQRRGPRFLKMEGHVRYRWKDVLAWTEDRAVATVDQS